VSEQHMQPLRAELCQVIMALMKNPLSASSLVCGFDGERMFQPERPGSHGFTATIISPNHVNGPNAHALYHLLMIAQRWEGYFDPFVWNGRFLWVRNSGATAYERALLTYHDVRGDLIPFPQLLTLYRMA
jgi:hypothetical protein